MAHARKTIVSTLVVLLTASWFCANSQSNRPPAIDSLREVWSDSNRNDTIRMRALYDLISNEYLYSKPDSAGTLAEDLLDFARSQGNKSYEADAFSLLGSSAYLTGRYSEALEYFREYARIASANGLSKRYNKARNNMALALCGLGEFEKALPIYRENLEILTATQDSVEAAKCMNNLGLALLNLNRNNEALTYFKKGLVIFENTNRLDLLSYSKGNIATIYSAQGKIDSALTQLYDVLKIHQELNDVHAMITAHNSIAANLLTNGDIPDALNHSRRSAQLSEEINDLEGKVLGYTQIAGAYRKIEQLDSATTYFQKALLVIEEVQMPVRQANILKKLGDIERKLGNTEAALEYFAQSKSMRSQINDHPGISDILVSEANIDKALGNLDEAESKFKRAIEIQVEYADSLRLLTTYVNLGMLYIERNNIETAKMLADKAIELSKNFGGIEHQQGAHHLKYNSAKKTGKYKDALIHLEHYMELRDSIMNDQNKSAMMRHQLEFEYERRELELRAESAKKDAQSTLQIERQQRMIYSLAGGGVFVIVVSIGAFHLYRQRERNKTFAAKITARDLERNRLSRELHDNIANELFGLEMAIDNGNFKDDQKSLNKHLKSIRTNVRHISHDLALPDIQYTSLPEMTQYLVERRHNSAREIKLSITPKDYSQWEIKSENWLHMYRILQEGISNALNHSSADHPIKVSLQKDSKSLLLTISNHLNQKRNSDERPGIGLKNLSERARIVGGSTEITVRNNIALLEVKIPLQDD